MCIIANNMDEESWEPARLLGEWNGNLGALWVAKALGRSSGSCSRSTAGIREELLETLQSHQPELLGGQLTSTVVLGGLGLGEQSTSYSRDELHPMQTKVSP